MLRVRVWVDLTVSRLLLQMLSDVSHPEDGIERRPLLGILCEHPREESAQLGRVEWRWQRVLLLDNLIDKAEEVGTAPRLRAIG